MQPLITYKADLCGIAVVNTEESHASKTSFVNGDVLEIYQETRKNPSADAVRHAKIDKRSEGDRNKFAHKNRRDRRKVAHADANYAFNIIRKVFRGSHYHTKPLLKYALFRVDSRVSVTHVLL